MRKKSVDTVRGDVPFPNLLTTVEVIEGVTWSKERRKKRRQVIARWKNTEQ